MYLSCKIQCVVFLLLAIILNGSNTTANGRDTGGNKPKVLITHPKIAQKAIDLLIAEGYELTFSEVKDGEHYPSRETILQDIKGMNGVVWFGHIHVDDEMIRAAGPQLKVVGSMGAGYNHVDVKLLYDKDIKVSNTPNILSSAVADMAIGLALAVSRNIVNGAKAVKEGNWVENHPSWLCGPTFEEATVGVIGLGAIGSKIVQRVKSFDVKEVLYYSRHQKPAGEENGAHYAKLDDLLERSDFIFIIVPLSDQTRGLINKDKFKKMKKKPILINSARGEVVVTDDLLTALKDGDIKGAALDVTDPEPLPKDHELLKFDNVVVTPHISSATLLAREKMAVMAAENVIKALKGEPLDSPIPKPEDKKT